MKRIVPTEIRAVASLGKRAAVKKAMLPALVLAVLISIVFSISVLAQGGSERVVSAKGYLSTDAVHPGDKFKIAVALEVANGYHINAHHPSLPELVATEVKFESPAGVSTGQPRYPAPEHRKFGFAPDTELAVHEGTVFITAEGQVDKRATPGAVILKALVTVQSCNDNLCLGPADLPIEIPIRIAAASQPAKPVNSELFAKAEELAEFQGNVSGPNKIAELITSKGLVLTLGVVFFWGLLLNGTPCVYPIIPITIGFFINQGASGDGKPNLRRTFSMALMYVLGLAITYSVLGVVASFSKGLFGAALQNPIVLISLAVVMLALALSMFGVYEFKLPESLNRLANSSTQSTSGIVGALVMGLTMGIVAAPCIGPVIIALLVFVGEKGDPVYGFFMFFVLALGLGFPYLILGTFSGAIKSLPRSGLWMVTVRKVFGLVLIGMALYFLMPLMGDRATLIFVVFFALSALYLIVWEAARTKPAQFAWILRVVGVASAVVAVMMALPKKIEAEIEWQPYSEAAILDAQRTGKAVIVDTFADWCIPCKELDKLTFTDSTVKREAERFIALKLNLTSNDPDSEAGRARRRFGIRGVPTVLFIDPKGREVDNLRLEGFEKPAAFLSRMKQVESVPTSSLAKGTVESTAPVADAASGSAATAAPSISLSLLNGGTLEIASLRGKVVIVDFWATWCIPCLSEIPMFNQLKKEYEPKGLQIVAIALDEEGASKVKPFVKAHPMDYTLAIGDQNTASAFGISPDMLPVTLVVDKQGKIRVRHIGITNKETLQSELDKLISE